MGTRFEAAEAEIAELKRQLAQRPIVYQYPGTDAEDDASNEDSLDNDNEYGLEDAMEAIDGKDLSIASQFRRTAKHATRHARRTLRKCRRQQYVHHVEKWLRWFTRLLLTRPGLLWIFYIQLMLLWFIEIWRQAMSRTLSNDPSIN